MGKAKTDIQKLIHSLLRRILGSDAEDVQWDVYTANGERSANLNVQTLNGAFPSLASII